MKMLVCLLILSCLAGGSAIGGDSREMLRDRLILCSQVVIEHPYPAIFRDLTGFRDLTDCCRSGSRVRDCHIYDWYENHGLRERSFTRASAEATN
jgi:hypothetical protein